MLIDHKTLPIPFVHAGTSRSLRWPLRVYGHRPLSTPNPVCDELGRIMSVQRGRNGGNTYEEDDDDDSVLLQLSPPPSGARGGANHDEYDAADGRVLVGIGASASNNTPSIWVIAPSSISELSNFALFT